MQVFDATVRLTGNLLNEVRRYGLTVPEIYILQRIHGDAAAVVNIAHVGDTEVDGFEERQRLSSVYDEGLANLDDEHKTSVEKMFGGEFAALPEKLREFKGALVERFDGLEEYQKPPFVAQEDVPDPGQKTKEKVAARKAELAATFKQPKKAAGASPIA